MRIVPAIIASAAFFYASTLSYAANPGFTKNFTVNATATIRLCSNSGIVHVTGTGGNAVQISAVIHKSNWHSGSSDEMKKIAAAPPVQQTGGTIQIGNETVCGQNGTHDIDIDYTITAPKSTNVSIRDGAGNLQIETVGGFVHAFTGKGDIAVNSVGPDSRLVTGAGNLDIQNASGMLLVRTGNGDINVRDSNVSDSQLRVGAGNIVATNLKGGVRASTGNGNVTMAGNPTAGWEMRTGNGSIAFHADPGSKFELDAESGSGTIDSTLPGLSGHSANGVMRGSVNGGGPVVKMYTGNGSITLQ